MQITRRDVLRRLAGVATAATVWASTVFVLDDDIPSVVAGRQAQSNGRRPTDVPRGGPNAAPGTTAPTTTVSPGEATTSIPTGEVGTTTAPTNTTAPGETTTTATPSTTSTTRATTETTQPPPTTRTGSFTIMLRGLEPNRFWWDAKYERTLPFTPGVGWVDGDRLGYRSAWMFLERDGTIVGRVTFVRIPEATYALVSDKYMTEGVRYFDGTLAPQGTQQTVHVNFSNDIVDQSYEAFTGSDQRPTLRFVGGGDVLEVRDYKKTVVENGIKFRQVSASDSRVTVVAYENDLPVIVVYYDSLHPSVRLTTDL